MIVTNAYKHIQREYNNGDFLVNDILRYDFMYNNYNVSVMYTKENGLSMQLTLYFTIEDQRIVLPIYFIRKNDDIEVDAYIKYGYKDVKEIFTGDEGKTKPFFEYLFGTILVTRHPIVFDRTDFRNIVNIAYQNVNNEDRPFFMTFRRSRISEKMIHKVFRLYSNSIQIIEFCRDHGVTLVFTGDLNLARDINIVMSNY